MTKQTNVDALLDKPQSQAKGVAEDYRGSDQGMVSMIDEDDDLEDEDDVDVEDDDFDVEEIDVNEGDVEPVPEVIEDEELDDDLSLDDEEEDEDDV